MYDIKTIERQINNLGNREKTNKADMSELSRTIMECVMDTKDVRLANRMIEVLTPINKKAATLFFKHFLPFTFDDEAGKFLKMQSDKKVAEKAELCAEFLADPHQNIWSWSDRNIDMSPKPLDLKTVTRSVEKYLKKAEKEGIKQSEVMRAILAAGLDVTLLVEVINSMAEESVKEDTAE